MTWQDISTAPKETEVIVYDPNNIPPVFTAWLYSEKWSCSVEGRHAPDDDYFGDAPKYPTHWQPLPPPPGEER